MIYPDNFEKKIGFDRIRSILKESCLGELGQQEVDAMGFDLNYQEIVKMHDLVSEFMAILNSDKEFPVDHYHNMVPVLDKIRVEGTFMEVQELYELKLSLEVIKSIQNFFKSEEENIYPKLKELALSVDIFPFVIASINKIITGKGKIKDNASADLGRIRRSLRDKSSQVSNRMHAIMKKAKQNGLVSEDTELSIRNGRMVIPLHSSDKRKINGLVHDASATGKTTFVEPAEIVELNNEIRELEYAEKREIVRILIQFTDTIRPYLDDLKESYEFLGKIDFIRAKAMFARRVDGVKPVIVDQPEILWENAVHPLLLINFRAQNKEVIPLDITLNKEKHILLISGPNAGGKSVCLQTVGLLQYMFQCGIPVPVKESSHFGIFKKIFLDFGDEQSIENDLSTYSSHLLNMKFFVKNADSTSLVLIDEFGTGTEPLLGGAIAQAILGQLNESGSYGVITTHYTNLKHFASSAEGIENGAMLFDHQKIQPLFRLQIGKPGSSFAFEIARSIGLPEDILKVATGTIGEDHIYFDKHLREIARDKRYWENKRSRIRQSEKKLEETLNKYSEELGSIKQEKKQILDKAKREAEELLNGVNRKIEKTIRVIRETQAEKEKTKQVREELTEAKTKLEKGKDKEEEKIERKIRQLKENEELVKRRQPKEENEITKPNVSEKDNTIREGDKVRMKGQDTVGEVLEISGKRHMVAFGSMITNVKLDKIEKISRTEFRAQNRQSQSSTASYFDDLQKRKLKFKPNLDLRGKRAEEAIRMVQDLIDEAIMVESKELSILHGKGNGILRQMIREFLATVDVVETYKDEHPDRGGYGITLVKLDF